MSRRPPRHLARPAEVTLTNTSDSPFESKQSLRRFAAGLCAGAHSKHTCGKALPVRPKGAAAKRKAEKEKRPKKKEERRTVRPPEFALGLASVANMLANPPAALCRRRRPSHQLPHPHRRWLRGRRRRSRCAST